MIKIPEKFSYLEINDQLKEAFESIFDTRENTLIIGNAGTGKSESLKIIREVAGNSSIFLAPTGTAAVNIGGQTIHSFFKLPPTLITESDIKLNEETAKIVNSINRIIIDECPMVRVDVFDAIDTILKHYRNSNEPFGGVQMILVGDLYQLPPITKEDSEEGRYIQDVWGGSYFFNSFAYKNAHWNKIELQKVYRQKDPLFTKALNNIRKGNHSEYDLEVINERVMPKGKFLDCVEQENYIFLTAFNKIADKENSSKLSMLKGDLKIFNAIYDKNINPKNFMPPEILEVKVGAKVMLLNNAELWKNGDMGIVDSIEQNSIYISLFRGGRVKVEPVEFEEYEYAYDKGAKTITKNKKGSFIQYPLKLAWALTIHKAQGATFTSGYVSIGKFFAPHMAYVTLSRFTDLNSLGISKPIIDSDIFIKPEVQEFMRTFTKRRIRS